MSIAAGARVAGKPILEWIKRNITAQSVRAAADFSVKATQVGTFIYAGREVILRVKSYLTQESDGSIAFNGRGRVVAINLVDDAGNQYISLDGKTVTRIGE